ncbi:MAG TPA: hypothetical protein VD908_14845 [Cytophagales bacterium]|nr:hypothetical protein [Cytophagales bacterium]
MKREQIIWTIILLFSAFSFANAQSNYYLKIEGNAHPLKKKLFIDPSTPVRDSLTAAVLLEELVQNWRNEGFLTASLDSSFIKKDTIYAYLSVGEKYRWVKLGKGNVDESFLRQVGFKEKLYLNRSFSISEYKKLQYRLITLSENRGNPFASIKLDSIKIEGSGIIASLKYSPGPFISYDTLTIVGTAKIKPGFVARYFNIKKGNPFNRSKITEAENSVSEFPSVKLVRPTDIIYSNYKAYPVFFLNHRPANVIDGIIGFLPNENKNQKLLVTGQLNLNLFNIGGSGKDLLIEWNKLKPLSQLLNLQFNNYNLLRTGLDLETKFNLTKEDTTFINIVGRINISKPLRGNYGRIKFFSELKNSRIGSNVVENQLADSVLADFNLVSYGLGYQWQNLDDVIFPRKGLKFTVDGLIGNKTIRRNPTVDSTFNGNISGKSLQSSLTASIQSHLRIKGKSGLYAAFSGGFIFNDRILINDMFRIGGLKTLRGFNENFFFASGYGISNLEFRYFYEAESFFMLFYDQAFLRSEFINMINVDYPLGIGAGLNLKTDVGTLQVVYSLGKSNSQPLNFNYSKIHFGIINRF